MQTKINLETISDKELEAIFGLYIGGEGEYHRTASKIEHMSVRNIILHGFCRKSKLYLRPVSSMTNKEWQEVRDFISHETAVAVGYPGGFSDKPKWILVLENRIATNTLSFKDGMALMGKGYDVLGLIEFGIAIEKNKTLVA